MSRESQIQIHRTEAAGATPSGLTSGELAVNLKDQKLFVGLSSGGYLTFNSVLATSIVSVASGNGIYVVGETEAGVAGVNPPSINYIVLLNPDITGHTLNITGNAIFSGYDSGVTFNGRVSIGNGNPETSGGWGLYRNPDAYNTTPSSGVAGLVDFTKTIASSIDYANRVGGKVAELVPANAYFPGIINVKTVLDIDSITGAGMFLAKAYATTGQGNLIGQYLGNLGGVPPLYYKNAPGDTPQTTVNSELERALLVENINVNFQALGLNTSQIGTPYRTLIQYGTWIDNIQSPSGLGGAPAASGTYETTFDKYVRTGYLLRGGTGTSGGATGTYVWSQWKNLVETTDDLGKYGVSTVNGGTGDISITGAGNDAAVVVRSSVAGTNRIDARVATSSLTGVASFHPGHFTVTNGNVVASFSGGVTFNGGLSASGLVYFTNGLTSPGGIHTVTQTFNGGIQTTGLTATNGLSASGLVYFTNGLTSLGGIHTVGLTANTAVFNGLATFNTGLTTTGLATFSNGLTARGGISTDGLTANIINVSDYIISTNGIVIGKEIQNVSIFPNPAAANATGLVISGDILQVKALATTNPGTTFAGNVFAPTIKASNIVNQIAFGNATLTGNVSLTSGSNVTMTVVGNQVTIASSSSVGGGVTGIAFGDNNTTAIVGQVSITAGSNVTLTRSGNQITIASGGTITNTGVTGIAFGNATLTGNVSLTSGSNVTMTVVGNQVTIASSGSVGGGGATTSALNTWTQTQTFNGGIQTTGLTSTGGLSASGLVYFTNGLTAPGGIHTRGLTAFNIVGTNASFASGVTFTGVSVFSSGLSATGITANSVFTNKLTATNASFASGVTFTGVSVFSSGLSATGITANSVFTNKLTATNASFASGVTFNGTVSGAVKSFNGNDGVVTITGAGQGNGQAIKVTSTVAGSHLIDARLASYTLTGVAYFDTDEFNVDADGYVHIKNPNNGACTDCSIYANAGGQLNCENCGCVWASQCSFGGCVYTCAPGFSIVDGSGFGITGVSGSSGASLYFDPASLTAYTGVYSNKKTNYVLIYDGDETGLVKAKRASLENFFSENSSLIKSSTTGQLSNAVKKDNGFGTSTIELGVVLGNVAAGQEGLVKGASAYAYIETNTVRSFNGLTGSVTAVGSINGCTAAVVITGSASEIEVLNTCPNIVIGLPDNVTISNLNVLSGATFGGNISAKNVVTSVNGATGAITNVAKTDVSNDFTSSQQISNSLTVTGFASGYTVILNSPIIEMGDVNLEGDSVRLIIDNGSVGIYAYGSINQYGAGGIVSDSTLYAPNVNATQFFTFPNGQTATSIVTSFNGLTGAVAGVTTSAANIFTALNSFNAGLSASGATFANNIKVNGVNIGLGGGNIASNLGIGRGALTGNSGGLFNTAVGSGAMEIGTNSYSIAFGFNALNSCTGGGINNVALGSSTMSTISSASNNVAIGSNSSQNLIDGSNNVSIGGESLLSNANGSSNLAIGYQALSSNATSNNVGIGYQALYTNDEGQQNTAIGNEALKSIATTGSAERNTAIGYQAGRWKGTGTSVISNRLNTANDSIFIGWRARSSADAQTNQIVIGNNTLGGGSNTTTIGTTGTIDATIYGKLHGTNGVSGPTASFNSLTVSQNTTLGSTASNTTTIYGAKIVNESIYSNGTLRNVGINFANGQVQTLTGIGTGATGTTAIYFMGAPATGAGNVTLLVTNGGSMTGNTTTWEGRIKWPGGVKPTLSTTGIDVVSFVTPDAGTTIYGFLGGLNFS